MSFLAPLTFYHWLVGTIIVSWCSIELFYTPKGSVIPYQIMGTFLSVALFLFIENGFVVRNEIFHCLGGAAVFFVVALLSGGGGGSPKKPVAK